MIDRALLPRQVSMCGALEMFADYNTGLLTPLTGHPAAIYLDARIPGLPALQASLHELRGDVDEGSAFAVVVGGSTLSQEMPLIRMHSSCSFSEVGIDLSLEAYRNNLWYINHDLTALEERAIQVRVGKDLFTNFIKVPDEQRSKDCDCRAQRIVSQRLIAALGGIYFDLYDPRTQEGRGEGLLNKWYVAYQDQSTRPTDTAASYRDQELPYDSREYGHVARFLLRHNITRVQLLSNNPRKISALEEAGITVLQKELIVGITQENKAYLALKGREFGHNIPDEAALGQLQGKEFDFDQLIRSLQ